MKEKSDSPSVPYNFSRCFNDQCPQASKCLRYIAAQNETADYLYISIVNPARYPADGNQCECFKTAVKAYIKQLFRNKGIKEEPTYQRYTEEYIW